MKKPHYISASCTICNYTVHKNGNKIFNGTDANILNFLFSIYQHFGFDYNRFYKMDNLSKLGWVASEILLKGNLNIKKYKAEETGIVISNADSSLDSDLKYIASVEDIPSPSLFMYTLPNILISEICIRNNFKGEGTFFISNRFNAAFIFHYVDNLMNAEILKACICGWVELLGEEHKAVLFLVENSNYGELISFSVDHINNVFNSI